MIRRAVKVIVPKMPGRSNFLSCLIIFWFNMISRVGQEPSIYSHSGKNVESCRCSLNPAIDWFSYCGESCLTIVGPLATQFRWPYIPSLSQLDKTPDRCKRPRFLKEIGATTDFAPDGLMVKSCRNPIVGGRWRKHLHFGFMFLQTSVEPAIFGDLHMSHGEGQCCCTRMAVVAKIQMCSFFEIWHCPKI